DPFRDARSDRGAHVILVELLDHRGAYHPGEGPGDGEPEGDRRQRDLFEVQPRILRQWHPVADECGEYPPATGHVGEPLDEEDREPERGRGKGEDGNDPDELVGPAV